MKKEGWKYCKLGDICLIYQPKTISTSQLCDDGRYLVYGANGVIGRYNEYNHKESEVLLCCRGATCGAINVSKEYSWINGNAMVVTPLDNSISKTFLKYLLLSIDYSTVITGAAQPQITRKTLAPIEIKYPNEKDQQKIVEYLDSTFEKIDKIKEDAEKKIAEAKLLFQTVLNGSLALKNNWLNLPIKTIGEVIGGSTPETSIKEYWTGDNCWISPAELKGNRYIFDSAKKISNQAVKDASLKMLPIGTVILSSRAPIGKVAINKIPLYCNQGFKCVLCGDKIYNEFLYWWFWGNTKYLNSIGKGATFKEISKKIVENITIPVPPLAEQQQIVTELDSLSEKTKAIEEKCQQIITECDRLKQAILKQVFE